MQAMSLKRTQFTDDERRRIVAEAAGASVKTVCRNHCISFSTFYRWRARLAEHQTQIGTRLFNLECENRKLKKQVAELWLDYTSLRSALIDGMEREC